MSVTYHTASKSNPIHSHHYPLTCQRTSSSYLRRITNTWQPTDVLQMP